MARSIARRGISGRSCPRRSGERDGWSAWTPRSDPTDADPAPRTPEGARKDVEYRGAPLDPERGPGLGCFWLQVIVLTAAVVLTPLSAAWEWPILVTIVLMATTLVLLLFVGQTVIFLLRLVAADRRVEGRRRPMQSRTRTVGEIEDEASPAPGVEPDGASEQDPPTDRSGPG